MERKSYIIAVLGLIVAIIALVFQGIETFLELKRDGTESSSQAAQIPLTPEPEPDEQNNHITPEPDSNHYEYVDNCVVWCNNGSIYAQISGYTACMEASGYMAIKNGNEVLGSWTGEPNSSSDFHTYTGDYGESIMYGDYVIQIDSDSKYVFLFRNNSSTETLRYHLDCYTSLADSNASSLSVTEFKSGHDTGYAVFTVNTETGKTTNY